MCVATVLKRSIVNQNFKISLMDVEKQHDIQQNCTQLNYNQHTAINFKTGQKSVVTEKNSFFLLKGTKKFENV
jgi:hypothetical protein